MDDYEPQIATGYEALALRLESHIRWYQPDCWIVPINDVAHTPMLSPDTAKTLMAGHRNDSLDTTLKDLETSDKQFEPWYVKEAVNDYFAKRLYQEFEDELEE